MTISTELKGPCTICIQQLLNHTEVLQEACKKSHIDQRVITERPSDSNKTVLQDTKSVTRNEDVANRGETRQENGANKKTRKESDTLEITDTKEPNVLNKKVILFADKAIQSGQEENVQWLSKTDSNRNRGTKRPSSSKTNVTNDQSIVQKKTEIYVVKL
ncbi:hypothetical protein DPMN_146388 [Dreissena polymorpha]|uniref:Uncharacterized protein n=1 Tax=Dreissena polymorpha TaxID=45954 RepID=A0A9D4FBN5_DREPO|nr:hypothetical protein DPMN_146388 [Dreissena polymorpha]